MTKLTATSKSNNLRATKARLLLSAAVLAGAASFSTSSLAASLPLRACVDNSANQTTCTGDVGGGIFNYVESNEFPATKDGPNRVGDFTLNLTNVTATDTPAIVVGELVEGYNLVDVDAQPLVGNGTMVLTNTKLTSVSSGAVDDPDIALAVLATGNATITLDATSSVKLTADKGASGDFAVGAFSVDKGNVTITSAAGSSIINEAPGEVYGSETFAANGVVANANDGIVTVNLAGSVSALHGNGIQAHSDNGEVNVTSTGGVSGGWNGIEAHSTEGDVKVTTGAGKTYEGKGGNGIGAYAGDVYYDSAAVKFVDIGGGNVTVNASGTVKGLADQKNFQGNGIDAWTREGTTTVNVLADGNVSGIGNGSRAQAGYWGTWDVSGASNTITPTFFSGGSGDATINVYGKSTGTKYNGAEVQVYDGIATIDVKAGGEVSGENGARADAGYRGVWGDSFEVGGGGDATIIVSGTAAGKVYNGAEASTTGFIVEPPLTMTAAKISKEEVFEGTATVIINKGGTATGEENGATARAGYRTWEMDEFFHGGGGDAIVTVDGTATGTKNNGAKAWSRQGTATVTVSGTATGGNNGVQAEVGFVDEIWAVGSGTASVTIKSGGTATGGENGIRAWVKSGQTIVTTEAGSTVTGEDGAGINAEAGRWIDDAIGGGNVTVNADGAVTGNRAGINAWTNDGDVDVTTGAAAHVKALDGAGINAATEFGDVSVSNAGLAEGTWTGVHLYSTGERNFTNEASGYVRNLDGKFDSNAVQIDPGDEGSETLAEVLNLGQIDGRMEVNYGNITNSGLWNTREFSAAEGGTLTNTAQGLIVAAHDAENEEWTQLRAATINNLGLINLADAAALSGNQVEDELLLDAEFYNGGGTIGINTYLGNKDSASDKVYVAFVPDLEEDEGEESNINPDTTTLLQIVNTNAGAGELIDETTAEHGILTAAVLGENLGAFGLVGGVASTGAFDYYMVPKYDEVENETRFELFSKANDGAHADAAVSSAASAEVWQSAINTFLDRQQQLRAGLTGAPVITAAADVGPSEESNLGALWLEGSHGRVDHNGTSQFNNVVTDAGFDQSVSAIVGGADFGHRMSNGGTMLFGVLGGYVMSDIDFSSRANSLELKGYTAGVYASWMKDGLFITGVAKADFLDAIHSTATASGKTDVTTLGVRADAGYRMALGDNVSFEPLLSATYSTTDVGAYTVGINNFGASTNSSGAVGAGARLGFTGDMVQANLTGRLWQELSGDNAANVAIGGTPNTTTTSSGAFEGAFGEVEGNLALKLSQGFAVYGGANVKFDSDTTASTGFGGFHFSW